MMFSFLFMIIERSQSVHSIVVWETQKGEAAWRKRRCQKTESGRLYAKQCSFAAACAKQRFFCASSWEETKVPSSEDFSILDFNGGAR